MTSSKRNIEKRIGTLEERPGSAGLDEIVVTDYVVHDRDAEPEPFAQLRCGRDESGEWCSEEVRPGDKEWSGP